MKIQTNSWMGIDREQREYMENSLIDEAVKRYKVHLEKKGKGLGAPTEFHIREVLKPKVYIRVEGELNVSFKDMDKVY